MKIKNSQIFIIVLLLTLAVMTETLAAGITATVRITVCGNGIIDTGEQCDPLGPVLGGQTCQSKGYTGGTLSCWPYCEFNTSGCTSGGGGGGGGVYIPPSSVTKVILQGKSYPQSSVTVLQDGKVTTTTIADAQANFKIEITNITPGTWTFGIWAEDKEGRKSITFNFTTSVTSGVTTTIGGIFLPPSIELEKTGLQKGETLNILGQTAPQSEVSIFVNSPGEEIVKKTKAATDGTWFYGFDTTLLDEGSHNTRAKATSPEGLLSTFSQTLAFSVGKEMVAVIKKVDINKDGKTNLVDFSILLYNWGIPKNPAADLNGDGKVNLTDFSIMLYWWTG